jgi:predicted RNA-binding Zn-ribbon protein involved in translation (DUF1610 family)
MISAADMTGGDNAPRVQCPDCGSVVQLRETGLQATGQWGLFLECPACAVGSPLRDWHQVKEESG